MDSPSPEVVTINSRHARRASSVWGIPNLANRLLQVGLLSSIASRPLSPATIAFAVSISACAFICNDSLEALLFSGGELLVKELFLWREIAFLASPTHVNLGASHNCPSLDTG